MEDEADYVAAIGEPEGKGMIMLQLDFSQTLVNSGVRSQHDINRWSEWRCGHHRGRHHDSRTRTHDPRVRSRGLAGKRG